MKYPRHPIPSPPYETMFGLNSFRTELLLLVISLFSLVLIAVFIAVNQANEDNARVHLEETLSLTSFAFQRGLESRKHVLLDKARILSADYAFKKAVATKDHATILSVLDNHRGRAGADVMMLADLEGLLIADTLHPQQQHISWSLSTLQAAAEQTDMGEASGIQLLDGKPYQLVLTPLFTPDATAWIIIGFSLSDTFSQELAEQTHSDVSLLYKHMAPDWRVFASTLSAPQQNDLLQHLLGKISPNQVEDISLRNSAYLSLVLEIQGEGEGQTLAVLQRSLAEALKPYMRLRRMMLLLFGLGLLFAVISTIAIARSLSRPLEQLTQTVKHIDAGDYQETTVIQRKDELGTLSTAIGHMRQGLQERDQVRDLLGKVVSPEIASELLSKEIELGGEERVATILFSDIRQFTNLCEHRKPKDILNLLNRYLSSMSDVIEAHDGAIDKYIGDAIMALFGTPIERDNAEQQAVRAAIAMTLALEKLNTDLRKEGIPAIQVGIGINSGKVVAGNMGSTNRLNYTVIGDGVNLASRLEGLTKYFGVDIIVSESTMLQCKNLHFRELGAVKVKGKDDGIRIFEPLAFEHLSSIQTQRLQQHHQALEDFRKQRWESSQSHFEQLQKKAEDFDVGRGDDRMLYQLYLDNIKVYSQEDLGANWQGELIFKQK